MLSNRDSVLHNRQMDRRTVLLVILFLIITAAGLAYVKWWPYYHKVFTAMAKHSIGSSIMTGDQASAPLPSLNAAWEYAVAYYKSVWKAVILGILVGSLVQVMLPSKWLLNVLGKTTFGSTAWGGLASIPAMMCSCCAAPIAVGLRKKNASVGASLAFWLGNPLINPATLIFMTFVLSWKFTLIRLFFGLILTFGVSYFAGRFASGVSVPEPVAQAAEAQPAKEKPLLARWLGSMWGMIVHIVPAYIIAVLLLGAFRAWMFPLAGDGAFTGILAVIGFAIAGTLFVIPTAAEIPIIQTFLSFGLGTGAAAALLVTLPAVSLPSILMVYKAFPKKVVLFVVLSVIGAGVLSGITGALIL